jgi:hypothetical protein
MAKEDGVTYRAYDSAGKMIWERIILPGLPVEPPSDVLKIASRYTAQGPHGSPMEMELYEPKPRLRRKTGKSLEQ